MIRRSTKLLIKLATILFVVGLVVFTGFTFWVITGPRSSSIITHYVADSLNSYSDKTKVTIESSEIFWDGWQQAFSIKTHNVDIYNDKGEVIAHFPESKMGINLFYLLMFKPIISDFSVVSPEIKIDTSVQPSEAIISKGDTASMLPIIANFLGLDNSLHLPVSQFRILDAKIAVNNGSSEMLWYIPEGYIKRFNSLKGMQIEGEVEINFGTGTPTYIHIEATPDEVTSVDKNAALTPTMHIKHLPLTILYDLYPKASWLREIQATADITLIPQLRKDGSIEKVAFSTSHFPATLNIPALFTHTLHFDNIEVRGYVAEKGKVFQLESLSASQQQSRITLSGSIKNTSNFPEFHPDIALSVTGDNMTSQQIMNTWPIMVIPTTRNWLASNIKGGHIKHIEVHAALPYENHANRIPLPEGAIQGSFSFLGASTTFHSSFPATLTHATGSSQFNAKKLSVTLQEGRLGESIIKKAMVNFPEMRSTPLSIEISGQASGPAKDLVLFSRPYTKNVPFLQQDNLAEVTGTSLTDIYLKFPIKHGVTHEEIIFDVSAHLNAALPEIMPGITVDKSDLQLIMDNTSTQLSGTAAFNGVPLQLDLKQKNPGPAQLRLKGTLNAAHIRQLAGRNIPFIEDTVTTELDITLLPEGYAIKGQADLTQATIHTPVTNAVKEKGRTANLAFSARYAKGKPVTFTDVNMTGKNLSFKGDISFLPDFSKPESFNFTVDFDETKLTATYKKEKAHNALTLKGKKLDLSKAKFPDLLKKDAGAKGTTELQVTIDNVHMKNDQMVNQLDIHSSCQAAFCRSMSLYGKLKDNHYLVASYSPLGDKRRTLLIESDDAETILKSLDVSHYIKGGSLMLHSVSEQMEGKTLEEGTLKIKDFKVIKMPLLGKLFTLASLKGINDLVQGQGIHFETFEAPFTSADGVITVTKARTAGSSVGITGEGTINTTKGILDLSGTVVPAQMVNTLIGKIPVFGSIITGGEGEGIIATTYKIKGPYQAAEITVNPLSIITPGFLRKLFDLVPDLPTGDTSSKQNTGDKK